MFVCGVIFRGVCTQDTIHHTVLFIRLTAQHTDIWFCAECKVAVWNKVTCSCLILPVTAMTTQCHGKYYTIHWIKRKAGRVVLRMYDSYFTVVCVDDYWHVPLCVWVLCRLMTPVLSKDIRFRVWPHSLLCLHTTRSRIKTPVKCAVSLVTATSPRVCEGYCRIRILQDNYHNTGNGN